MAANFSANQYEKEFTAKALANWEVPKWYPKYPRRRTDITRFIANDRGHLLNPTDASRTTAWGFYMNTWQLPNKITKQIAFSLSAPPVGISRWTVKDDASESEKIKIPSENGVNVKNEKVEVTNEEKVNVCKPEKDKRIEEFKKMTERQFNEKEKLNDPIAISRQGRRAIRHETLERDDDLR